MPGVQSQEQVRIAGHRLVIALTFQVEPPPFGTQRAEQRGLPALAGPQDDDGREIGQMGHQQRFVDAFHDLQYKG
jgi:hypothetical protein